MTRESRLLRTIKRLRMLTYVSATVMLIINNDSDKLTYLIPLVFILLFLNYFREYYLDAQSKPIQWRWLSIALEMLLIIGIGIIDTTDINILFYYVCIASTIITYQFVYAVPLVTVYIASALMIFARSNGFGSLMDEVVPMLLSYGVSTAFVMVMSYLVKAQVQEKEKLEHINAELEQAYGKLIEQSALARKLSIEQERTRMAREIHDTLAHTLTATIIQLEACKKLAALDPSRLSEELDKAQALSRSGLNDVKRTIKALRPQILESKSLLASIMTLINEAVDNANITVNLNNELPQELELPSQVEVALFRVVQESITNSIRHGEAKSIEVFLGIDENALRLRISDNGIGCKRIRRGYGLQGIRERIEALQGSVNFSGTSGFTTTVTLPRQAA